jgi:hypothetical protein
VTRWDTKGNPVERWSATVLLWAERGFRKIKGHEDLPQLRAALGWPSFPTARSARRFRSGLVLRGAPAAQEAASTPPAAEAVSTPIVSRCEQNHPPLLTLQETPPKQFDFGNSFSKNKGPPAISSGLFVKL